MPSHPPIPSPPQTLQDQGLTSAAAEVARIIPRVSEDLLTNMEANRKEIANSLELALLSRELPDRLLLFKAIQNDPQLKAAKDLIVSRDDKYASLLSSPKEGSPTLAKVANEDTRKTL